MPDGRKAIKVGSHRVRDSHENGDKNFLSYAHSKNIESN